MRRFDRIFGLIVYSLPSAAWLGVASVGPAGEIAKVNHVFQRPAGWQHQFSICLGSSNILHASNGEDVSDLRAHSKDTRSETAEKRASAGIVRDLWYAYPVRPKEPASRETALRSIEMKSTPL